MFHSEGVAGGASIDNLIIKTVLEDMLSFSGGLALDKSSFKFGSKPGFFEVASLLLAASALYYAALACRVAKRALLTAEEFDRRAHKLTALSGHSQQPLTPRCGIPRADLHSLRGIVGSLT